MFGALGNIASLMKQAQAFGSQVEGLQEELRTRRFSGAAGGGLVSIEVNGLQEVQSCRIDPSLMEPSSRELLEELFRAAANDALEKARVAHAESMHSIAGRLAGQLDTKSGS